MKNVFQIIHIIGSMQSMFLFLLLIMRKENKLANKVLATLILILTINLAAAFFHTNNDQINDFMAIARSDTFIFAFGPLIAFYALFLTGFKEKLKSIYFLHLSPAAGLLIFLVLTNTFLHNSILSSAYDENNPYALRLWYVIHALALIHLLAYLIYGLIVVDNYKDKLSLYFAQSGRIYLLWLRILLISIIFICVLAIIQFLINSFHENEGVLQWIISITSVLLVFVMGYFTNTQPDILNDLKDMKQLLSKTCDSHDNVPEAQEAKTEAEGKTAKYEKNRLDETEEKANLDRLLQYVEEHKPYLDAELNLKQLSEGAGIPSHQLSMLLSLYLQQNFYTFINKYRVEAAKKMLAKDINKEQNILTIAFETGFNSKSTFNTVFKKLEGVTPSEYRSMNKKQTVSS